MQKINISTSTEEEFRKISNYAKIFNLDCDTMTLSQFLIARINGELAGFVRLKKHADCHELSTLGVLPEFRNGRIGKVLITEIINKSEAEKIYLLTVIPAYFKKYGFEPTCLIPDSLKTKKENCKIHCDSEEVTVMLIEKKAN